MRWTNINTGTIAASGSYTTEAYNITEDFREFMSLQWTVTGDGLVTIQPLISNNGADFLAIDSTIANVQSKITGPDGNGKNMANINMTACRFFKIRFSEVSGLNTATVTATLVTH